MELSKLLNNINTKETDTEEDIKAAWVENFEYGENTLEKVRAELEENLEEARVTSVKASTKSLAEVRTELKSNRDVVDRSTLELSVGK